jgi:carotenoid phi-ring synthase / carotenoid chi-ring synthase
MTNPQRIVIIGGGLAGLTAALHLAERGLQPIILEADPLYPGGRVGGGETVTVNGDGRAYTFVGEHGIHGVWGQYHNLRAMLNRAGIEPGWHLSRREAWILRHRNGRIQWAEGGSALRKSWIPAPFHYLALFVRPRFLQMLTLRDLASMFRVLGGLWWALAYDPAAEGAPLRGLTLRDYFRGWSPTMQALFTGLARNFASERPERVPQSGFIAFLRFYTLLRRDAWAFSYFTQDSNRALIAPLVEKILACSGQIRLDARVNSIEKIDTGWIVRWSGGELHADQVILAVDAPAARALLQSSETTRAGAEQLSWPVTIPTAVMRFWFRTTPKLMAEAGIFTGDFVLDNFFWLHRFQQDFVEWHTQTGGSAVEVHLYGPPELLQEPDAVLLARGLSDLQKVWGTLRGQVIAQSIRRNPATHTLFDSDGERLSVETPWQGLTACGDWVRYPHPSLYLERATVTGLAAANRILTGYGLEPFPVLPPTPPEPLARWMERGFRAVRRWARERKRKINNR